MNIRRSLATAVLVATAAAPLATAATPAFAETAPAGLEKVDAAGTELDGQNTATIKALLVWPNDYLIVAPSRYLREHAAAALAGTPEDRAKFVAEDMEHIRASDARVAIVQTVNGAGPVLYEAARAAFDSDDIEVYRAFLKTGQYVARAEDENRAKLQKIVDDPNTGPGVREGAQKALAGTGADVEKALNGGLAGAAEHDDRVRLTQIMSLGGPAVQAAANKAMSGTVEDVREFLKTGQYVARAEDEGRAELRRLLEDASTGPRVREGAAKALAGTAEDVERFLAKDLPVLRDTDDLVLATRIGDAGGPEVKKAATTALHGTIEDVRAFLKEGQYVARAKDEADAKAAAEAGKTTTVTPASDTTHPSTTTPATTPVAVTDGRPVGGGRLAYTGTDAPLGQLGAVGAASVALGAGALIATRRRSARS
ncbi:ALF repeat-containing protein [Kitasatospora sp. NPDC051853]|uniref:ALF repeat-containing protein n=1 Tax=Kitasatospora sp. NPDC051853 TaxID=3364058 RepID=UPI00379CD0C8